jgi:two-component system, chemotaxis family, CheB/CheR fusion protein
MPTRGSRARPACALRCTDFLFMKKTTTSVTPKRASAMRKTKTAAPAAAAAKPRFSSFPIVGLGASAGGLEALEQFFGQVPKSSGIGFVVVQHLDPTRKGIMPELLQRFTSMNVLQVKDGMKVKPDHVYVIPPNKDLSILHGELQLLEPAAPRGLRLPIDFFLRSLADDQREQSIGVILSGMGSDGTLGLRAVKERAGGTFVQSPASAKFDSMPRMAVDAGLADVVADAQELPGKIIAYLKHVPRLVAADPHLSDKHESALAKVLVLLRAQTGHDFSLYKKSTIYRRIERRMGLHELANIADYVRYLRENPQESELLFKELLIGVTSFFRDPAAWEQLRDEAIPKLLAAYPEGGTLRAWSVGCSTGEEAFSLAIIFKEALAKLKPAKHFSLQIFATDLDKDAVDKARAGLYPENIGADVSEERLRQFFTKHEHGGFCVRKEIRETVIFAPQNLVMHAPFTKLDIVVCRNLLIYLDAELQRKLMPLFHFGLNAGGILLLGSSETVGAATDLFTPLPGKSRLYRRLDSAHQADLSQFPFAFGRARLDVPTAQAASAAPAPSLQSLADQLLLQRYSPAAVLVTNEGDILYVSGKTGKYLEPAAGKANWNLFAMSREGLGNALGEAFHKAVRQNTVVTLANVKVGTDGGPQFVDVTVHPVTSPSTLQGMFMVVFADVLKPPGASEPAPSEQASLGNARLAEMAQELQQAHADLQGTRDEMQTSQEELRSTNEELQSMNEELQSTNEELTTSKEEMQSMNEELQTVNQEMQAKVDELSRTGNDMKNLLDSTDIATLFLDSALLVRRFTPATARVIKLIASDVGRPITDIVSALDYPALASDTREVLRTLTSIEKQVTARDNRWFTVRVMPYRTQENRVDGVVITLTDISAAKVLEAALRKAQFDLEARIDRQGKVSPKPSSSAKTAGRPQATKQPKASGRPRFDQAGGRSDE